MCKTNASYERVRTVILLSISSALEYIISLFSIPTIIHRCFLNHSSTENHDLRRGEGAVSLGAIDGRYQLKDVHGKVPVRDIILRTGSCERPGLIQ